MSGFPLLQTTNGKCVARCAAASALPNYPTPPKAKCAVLQICILCPGGGGALPWSDGGNTSSGTCSVCQSLPSLYVESPSMKVPWSCRSLFVVACRSPSFLSKSHSFPLLLRRFSIPTARSKIGQIVQHKPRNRWLGKTPSLIQSRGRRLDKTFVIPSVKISDGSYRMPARHVARLYQEALCAFACWLV